jgi:hypothetical protein
MELGLVIFGFSGLVLAVWDLCCYFCASAARDKADMLNARAAGIELYKELRGRGGSVKIGRRKTISHTEKEKS